jgi:hypothetical protein
LAEYYTKKHIAERIPHSQSSSSASASTVRGKWAEKVVNIPDGNNYWTAEHDEVTTAPAGDTGKAKSARHSSTTASNGKWAEKQVTIPDGDDYWAAEYEKVQDAAENAAASKSKRPSPGARTGAGNNQKKIKAERTTSHEMVFRLPRSTDALYFEERPSPAHSLRNSSGSSASSLVVTSSSESENDVESGSEEGDEEVHVGSDSGDDGGESEGSHYSGCEGDVVDSADEGSVVSAKPALTLRLRYSGGTPVTLTHGSSSASSLHVTSSSSASSIHVTTTDTVSYTVTGTGESAGDLPASADGSVDEAVESTGSVQAEGRKLVIPLKFT